MLAKVDCTGSDLEVTTTQGAGDKIVVRCVVAGKADEVNFELDSLDSVRLLVASIQDAYADAINV